ncbi:MAG: hypothetical protein IJ710_09470 [Prevotella sp.]|nr:hypothetical protein [Prevotella sp.]
MKKTLLKTLTMAVALVSLTALTACSNDDETPIEQPTPSVTPSATIHFKTDVNRAGDDTRSLALSDDGTTLEAEWKAGEKVALIYGSLKFEASVTAVAGGVATIEADLPGDVPDGTSVRLIYPYAATGTAPESDDYLTLKNDLLEDQKGTLDYISQNLDVSTGNGTLRVDGSTASLDGNVTMANAFIIFKFALKDGEGNPLTGVKKFWLTKGIYSTASGADWFLSSSVTNDAGLDEVFMAAPMNGTLSYIQTWLGWVFTAATASQVYETGTLTGNDFKAGTYYRPTLKMNVARKPLSQADDDYRKPIGVKGGVAEIYNSGRAVDIFDADPVAIVVYSGSDADITEGKGHGLAMALKSAA